MTHTSQLKLVRQEVSEKEAQLATALAEAQEAQAMLHGQPVRCTRVTPPPPHTSQGPRAVAA